MSTKTFAELGVSRATVDALDKRGIQEPFAIQQLVIEDALAGRDVLAQSPTGSGKTLAFGVPLVDRIAAESARPAALILAPTRELASQIADEIAPLAYARALKLKTVYGGVGINPQIREAGRSHIVVATPGRLEDLLERRALTLDAVQVLVLDEADRMLDMGFKPAVDRIVAQCPKNRQTMFFSATLDGETGRAAQRYTKDPVSHTHTPAVDKPADIEHRFEVVARDHRMTALVRELKGKDRDLTLVFVRTKRGADRLTKKLTSEGIKAVAMHGDKSQGQRERALSSFEDGRVSTLVATDVAARGIDVAGISHVINFDPPEDHATYTHRIGRTGRAGSTGIGITFVDPEEPADVEAIATALKLDREFSHTGLASPPKAQRGHGAQQHHGDRHRARRGRGRGRSTR
jgi:superfamily II DNA/RNA helicase